MPSVRATATIVNDINFTLTQLGSSAQSESSALNYSRVLTTPAGTGTPSGLQINYGALSSGSIPSGAKVYFDLQTFPKRALGDVASINFTNIRSIVVENQSTSFGYDMKVGATGTSAFTEPWNGGAGNILVKPYSVWQYSDPISGATVDGSNKDFFIEDTLGSGMLYTVIVVGTTG